MTTQRRDSTLVIAPLAERDRMIMQRQRNSILIIAPLAEVAS